MKTFDKSFDYENETDRNWKHTVSQFFGACETIGYILGWNSYYAKSLELFFHLANFKQKLNFIVNKEFRSITAMYFQLNLFEESMIYAKKAINAPYTDGETLKSARLIYNKSSKALI